MDLDSLGELDRAPELAAGLGCGTRRQVKSTPIEYTGVAVHTL